MDPVTQNTQPVTPVQSTPEPVAPVSGGFKDFVRRKKVLIGIVAVLLLIGAVIAVILTMNRPQGAVKELPEGQTVKFKTIEDAQNSLKEQRLGIIKSVADYITTQKTPEGYNNYIAHFNEVCGGEKVANCPFGSENVMPINNSWSALGYFAAYEATKDEKYLDLMNKDIQSLISYCTPRKNDCLWVLAQPSIIYTGIQSPEILEFINGIGANLLATDFKGSIMIQSIRARELALFYEITKDQRYLAAAETVLQEVKQALNTTNTPSDENLAVASQRSQACWYTLAAAELAVATRDPKYLEEARLIDTDPEIQNLYLNVPFSVSVEPCAETYYLIYKITNDPEAYEKGERIVRYLEQNFYDSKENMLVWGENGVTAAKKTASVPEGVEKIVDMTDTAYFAYLEYLYYPRD